MSPAPAAAAPAAHTRGLTEEEPTGGSQGDPVQLIDNYEFVLLGAVDEIKKGSGQASSTGPSAPCPRACTALTSMAQSVKALCEQSASSDRRCEGAKNKLATDEAKAHDAGCSCAKP